MTRDEKVIGLDDPAVPDWHSLILPDAWPDHLNFRNPLDLWRFFSRVLSRSRCPVELPSELMDEKALPKYLLQEFHNLPNGNYSKKLTRGYITGFDYSMLGRLALSRAGLAKQMQHLNSVLDVGCAGGHMAKALQQVGIKDVWGLDPSPYLLQHAANDYPEINFVGGLAEDTGFANDRFDGVAVCFVLHELPPRYLDRALKEFNRILKQGGMLAILEPSPLQLKGSAWSVFKHWGWAGLYFRWLGNFVYEPFLHAWHNQSIKDKFAEFGFDLTEDNNQVPIRQLVAKKIA